MSNCKWIGCSEPRESHDFCVAHREEALARLFPGHAQQGVPYPMKREIPILVDSGAFSALHRGIEVKLDDYIAFCHMVKGDYPQAVFINLDVIGKGRASYDNWKTMRASGIPALPVYHVVTPDKWLLKYLDEADYVGIGAIAKMSDSLRQIALDRIWDKHLVDQKTRMPLVRVHGMGISGFRLMLRYPWYSVDSASFLHIASYGHVYCPRRKGGTWDFSGMPLKIGFSYRALGDKRDGIHFSQMSSQEKRVLLLYLKETGQRLGFVCKYGPDPLFRVRLRGVATDYEPRAELNINYYAMHLAGKPWPRPFPKLSRGFDL